jgi:glycine cleavage system H lipoate-binding protein
VRMRSRPLGGGNGASVTQLYFGAIDCTEARQVEIIEKSQQSSSSRHLWQRQTRDNVYTLYINNYATVGDGAFVVYVDVTEACKEGVEFCVWAAAEKSVVSLSSLLRTTVCEQTCGCT